MYKIKISLFLAFFCFSAPLLADESLQDALETPYPAPEIAGIEGWLNSPPLTLSALKGKVVLVDFWTYSCINCIRTLPYLTQWDAKYKEKGLVVLGIHAPEFEFEKDAANVEKAIAKYGIHYPVAMDNHLSTWSSFGNQYWPAHYLINQAGQVVYTHFGEGKYDVTEQNIRSLLGLKDEAQKTIAPGVTSDSQTPETYLGYARAQRFSGIPALVHESAINYGYGDELPLHHWELKGKWRVEAEKIVALEKNSAIRLHFNAKKVFLVLGTPTNQPITLHIAINGKKEKEVSITSHSLYTVIEEKLPVNATVEITSEQEGWEAYAFTFEG